MLLLDQFRQHPVFSSPLLPAVVQAILSNGTISRAEIARQAKLSKQTSSELVSALEALGWVRRTGKLRGDLGRHAEGYAFNPRSAYVLGIDIGGTKLDVSVADHSGAIVAERLLPSDPRGGRDLVRQIGAVTDELIVHHGIDRERLFCAVVGIPGSVQDDTGRIILAPNIPQLDEFDVVSALHDALGGVHVLVENDVNLAAVGESWNGLAQVCDDIAFVSLGTGVGMGLVAEGRLLRGSHRAAGEIGYLPIGGNPLDPRSQQGGALESVLGSDGIRRRYVDAGGAAGHSVRDIIDASSQDPIAGAIVSDIGRDLALALTAVVALIDPQRIVLGGSIGARAEIHEALSEHFPRFLERVPEVTISRHGSRATTMGAIATALDEVHRSLFGVHSLSPGLMPRTARKAAAPERMNHDDGSNETRRIS